MSAVDRADLRTREAVVLLAALVCHRARAEGIRLLVVKGLVLEQLGLREARAYADVDVMVDPARADDLVRIMGASGWRPRTHYWVFDRIEQHSVTLVNEQWPIDLDVHRFFPGFLAEPADVFEQLWERRHEFTIGNRPVDGNDAATAAAVAGLHALRGIYTERQRNEYDHLISLVRADEVLARELVEVALQTGSSDTLRPLLAASGLAEGLPVHDTRALRAWNRRIAHRSRTGEWLTYLGTLPLHERPVELWRIIWPPASFYVQEHPELAGSRRALAVARLRRLAYGFRGLLTLRQPDRGD